MPPGRWRGRERLRWPGTSRRGIPRGIIWRKSSRTSQCRGMKTPSYSSLVPRGNPPCYPLRQNDSGGQQFQRGDGDCCYSHQQQVRQYQPRPRGTGWVGNTGSGWYQPESPPPPTASMGEVYKGDRCGALGHKFGICRAPNAFTGTCGTCGASPRTHRQTVPYYPTEPVCMKTLSWRPRMALCPLRNTAATCRHQ